MAAPSSWLAALQALERDCEPTALLASHCLAMSGVWACNTSTDEIKNQVFSISLFSVTFSSANTFSARGLHRSVERRSPRRSLHYKQASVHSAHGGAGAISGSMLP